MIEDFLVWLLGDNWMGVSCFLMAVGFVVSFISFIAFGIWHDYIWRR